MGKGLSRRIAAAFATIAVCAAPYAHALDVYFAGFASLGDAAAITSNYPYSSLFNARGGGAPGALDRELLQRMRMFRNDTFDVRFDQLGTLGADSPSSIALAFVLDREDLSVEPLAGGYKIVAQLSAQALFFDFRESAVIANYPFTTQYVHHTTNKPTEAELGEYLRKMYLVRQHSNVFDRFEVELASIKLNRELTRRVQVTNVDIDGRLLSLMPPRLSKDERAARNAIGQDFSKFLSMNQDIPVLPYTVGYAIGNRMAGRFADGSVFSLKIPEPDYEISLALTNLKKIEFERTSAGASFVYGAYLHVKVTEPLSNTVYFDATIKNGASKIVPTSMTSVDDWAAYQETLLVLMDKFTIALKEPKADWAAKHVEKPGVLNEMKKLQKVLQSCR